MKDMRNEKCEKVSYEKKKDAQFKLNYLKQNRSVKIKPTRVYSCPNCGKYHLTHQNKYQISEI